MITVCPSSVSLPAHASTVEGRSGTVEGTVEGTVVACANGEPQALVCLMAVNKFEYIFSS